jgi:hypothetical protein
MTFNADFDAMAYGERLASIYDTDYAPPDPSQAVKFLAAHAGGGPVLELGIGTGRIALPLHATGIQVKGVELSEAMIKQMKGKPGGDEIEVIQGDFSEVLPEGPFNLAVAAYNTFFFLPTQERQLECFRRVAERLSPGGQFILECFVPDPARMTLHQALETVQIDSERVWLAASMHDPVDQSIIRSEIFLGSGGIQTFPLHLRYAWPSELDLMARLAGMSLRGRWRDWEGGTFGKGSRRHISTYGVL